MAKEKWIQKATEKMEEKGTKGSFREYCQKQGFSKTTKQCINKAKQSEDEKLKKKAVFAENVMKNKKGGK